MIAEAVITTIAAATTTVVAITIALHVAREIVIEIETVIGIVIAIAIATEIEMVEVKRRKKKKNQPWWRPVLMMGAGMIWMTSSKRKHLNPHHERAPNLALAAPPDPALAEAAAPKIVKRGRKRKRPNPAAEQP
jgi:hypothetical protein